MMSHLQLSLRTPNSQRATYHTSVTLAPSVARYLTDHQSWRGINLYTQGSPRPLISVSSAIRVSHNKRSWSDIRIATVELTSTPVLTVEKFSTDPQSWRGISAHTQRNPRCLISVHTAWRRSVNLTNLSVTRECTPERSRLPALSVEKGFLSQVTARHTKKPTKSSQRSLTAAPTAACASSRRQSSAATSALTPARSLSDAPCVRAASPARRDLKDTWGATQGNDRTNASSAERDFILVRIWMFMGWPTPERNHIFALCAVRVFPSWATWKNTNKTFILSQRNTFAMNVGPPSRGTSRWRNISGHTQEKDLTYASLVVAGFHGAILLADTGGHTHTDRCLWTHPKTYWVLKDPLRILAVEKSGDFIFEAGFPQPQSSWNWLIRWEEIVRPGFFILPVFSLCFYGTFSGTCSMNHYMLAVENQMLCKNMFCWSSELVAM